MSFFNNPAVKFYIGGLVLIGASIAVAWVQFGS